MSDRTIRELEQRAARDPRARLELATALERVGRPADALAASWAGCDDLAVRRAAARVDCERAPVRAGRLLWQRRLDGRDRAEGGLRAHPLALVACTARRTAVLDPRSGEKRVDLPAGPLALVDERLLISAERAVVGADAWTGEVLYELALPPAPRRVLGADVVVTSQGDEAVGHRADDPRRAPVEAWRWRGRLGVFRRGAVVGEAVVLDIACLVDAEGVEDS